MSILEQVVGSLLRVIRLNDRLDRLAQEVTEQQQTLEELTHRLIRVETALELLLRQGGAGKSGRPRLPKSG